MKASRQGFTPPLFSLCCYPFKRQSTHSIVQVEPSSIYELFEWEKQQKVRYLFVFFFLFLKYGSLFLGNMENQGDDGFFFSILCMKGDGFLFMYEWAFVFYVSLHWVRKIIAFTLRELLALGEDGGWYGIYQRRSWVAIVFW
ncbi:hypothetical protein GGI43DRAFT_286914 [Trichoderma evansii]